MSELSILPYSEDNDENWDSFVEHSRNGTFLHSRKFIRYHFDRFQDCSLLMQIEGKTVGVFPAHYDGERIMSHNGLTFGGLVFGMDQRSVLVHEMIAKICSHYRSKGFKSLYYKPVPKIFHKYPADDDLFAIHRIGGKLVRRDLSAAIPSDGPSKVSTLRKRGRKKAIKHGVEIRAGHFFDEFYELLAMNLGKHGAKPVHSLLEIVDLNTRCPGCVELVGAFEGNDLIAATWVFHFDKVLHTQYLTSTLRGQAIGALDHLLFHLSELAKKKGKALSFGASTEQGGTVLNKGLMAQKEGFGARGQVLDHYEIDLSVRDFDYG